MLVFRKILGTYQMDDPSLYTLIQIKKADFESKVTLFNVNISHKECKDVLWNKKCWRLERIESKVKTIE